MRGLTLIEVLVAMGIAVVAGVLLLVIIVNSSGLFTRQSSEVSTGLNINDTLLQLRSTIKQATAVASSYTSGSTTYTSGAGQIVLKVASIDSSNNIIEGSYDFFVFLLDGKTLRFKVFPDPASSRKTADQIFSTTVDNLIFKYFNSATPPLEVTPANAAKVRITLVFQTNIATSEANLRND